MTEAEVEVARTVHTRVLLDAGCFAKTLGQCEVATFRDAMRAALLAADSVRAEESKKLVEALQLIRRKAHAHNRGGEMYKGLRDEIRDICDETLAACPLLPDGKMAEATK